MSCEYGVLSMPPLQIREDGVAVYLQCGLVSLRAIGVDDDFVYGLCCWHGVASLPAV
jgi:hypothetical protein